MLQIQKRLKEIANLLWDENYYGYKGTIFFDHKSYDDENDIPRLKICGEIVLVEQFSINKEGDIVSISDREGNFYSMMITGWSDEWNDSYYESVGLFDLLRDVYYETKESGEIGDYEMDFIEE